MRGTSSMTNTFDDKYEGVSQHPLRGTSSMTIEEVMKMSLKGSQHPLRGTSSMTEKNAEILEVMSQHPLRGTSSMTK